MTRITTLLSEEHQEVLRRLQRFEEGLTAYLRHASQPMPPPVGQWEQNPALLEYQRAVRESSVHAPWVAQQLATEGAIMGRMADLRAGRHLQMGFRPSYAAGLGQIWVTPAAPPGRRRDLSPTPGAGPGRRGAPRSAPAARP